MSKMKERKAISGSPNDDLKESTVKSEVNVGRSAGIIDYVKSNWLVVGIIALVSLGAFGAGLKYLESDAKRMLAERNQSTPLNPAKENLLASINPFLPAPSPSSTPQLSKEYVYAGSRLLAVEDANANAAPPADLAVWRPSSGTWWVLGGNGSQQVSQTWGVASDLHAEGDYDGDGKTDFAVFRPSTGTWYVMRSSDAAVAYFYFGSSGDVVASADYDGDGKTDPALFRDSDGTWYIWKSTTQSIFIQQFGLSGDKPTPRDFDGDGKADITIWRSSGTPTFYGINSSNGLLATQTYGVASDVPAPADYDGDGKADYSVRRGATWYVMKSSDSGTLTYSLGNSTDIEVPNDYDGDGKADIAVWRNSDGTWYILNSSGNPATRIVQWGQPGDKPVPAFYRR